MQVFISRLNGPDAVLPIIDTIVARKNPRSVFVVGAEVRTYPAGGTNEARCLKQDGAVFVGTYDAAVDARQLYEDIRASLPRMEPVSTPAPASGHSTASFRFILEEVLPQARVA
jgi:hypothetical protein